MSDVSRGPGWWLASDGKWYPQHLHPNYLPPPPPASATAGLYGQGTLGGPQQFVPPVVPRSVVGDPLMWQAESRSSAMRQLSGGAWLAIISGALLIVGALTPWVAVLGGLTTLNGFQQATRGGLIWSWNGPLCLGFGVITAVIGLTRLMRAQIPRLLARAPIAAGLGAGIGVARGIGEAHSLAPAATAHHTIVSIGYGLWVALIGVIGAVASGFVLPALGQTGSKVSSAISPGWYAEPTAPDSMGRLWDGKSWVTLARSPSSEEEETQAPLPPFRRRRNL